MLLGIVSMRDFKAGRDINVGGDVHIHDESSQPKLLVLCSNKELFDERVYRKAVLSGERKLKFKHLAFFWLVSGVVLSAGALWFYANGQSNFSFLLLGFGSLAVAFASLNNLLSSSNVNGQRSKKFSTS